MMSKIHDGESSNNAQHKWINDDDKYMHNLSAFESIAFPKYVIQWSTGPFKGPVDDTQSFATISSFTSLITNFLASNWT